MKNVILILFSTIVTQLALAENVHTYICDKREVLTGSFTSGSGTKISIDEEKKTAIVFIRITEPNADWEPTYWLIPEKLYGAERYVSSKDLEDLKITFTRVGTYNIQPSPHSPEPATTGALVFKFFDRVTGKETTRVYLCSRERNT